MRAVSSCPPWEPSTGTSSAFPAGGPLTIPHLLSKRRAWYVYGWYEGVRVHQAANNTALVPTDAQLNGDFSGGAPIYNPYHHGTTDQNGNVLSGSRSRGNQIPQNLLNPVALQIAKSLLPAPNTSIFPGSISSTRCRISTRRISGAAASTTSSRPKIVLRALQRLEVRHQHALAADAAGDLEPAVYQYR